MNTIITGCERSGTSLVCKQFNGVKEPKMTPALYHAYEFLSRWSHYGNEQQEIINLIEAKSYEVEKHSLNFLQRFDMVEWLIETFDLKGIYVVRDGRDVIKSMHQKLWQGNKKKILRDCIAQWKFVINDSWKRANELCRIIHYEDIGSSDKYYDYFTPSQISYIENEIWQELKMTKQ